MSLAEIWAIGSVLREWAWPGYRARGPAVHGKAHDHVIEEVDMVVADLFDGPSEAEDARGAFPVRDAGKLDGELHGSGQAGV